MKRPSWLLTADPRTSLSKFRMSSSVLQVPRRQAWKDPSTAYSLLSHLGFRIWTRIFQRTKAQGRFQGQRIRGHLVISKRITTGVRAKKKDIPPRYYGDPQSTSNYLMFCDEDIQDPVSEQLKHYASPKGAHKQLHLFTHWFEYVDLGKELQAKGHTLRDVMITYTNWRELYQKTVPLLVGDMEAWTHVKYSPTWYSLVAKNRRIKHDVPDS